MNADFFIFIRESEPSELRLVPAEIELQPYFQLSAAKIIHHLSLMGSI
jgi:hypothetical protein